MRARWLVVGIADPDRTLSRVGRPTGSESADATA